MARYDYDLVTIGAGSGGVRASRMAAQFGARVAICEEGRVGGTCVIRGCVPKKLLVYGAHYADDFEDAAGYGWSATAPPFDWSTLIANKNREIDRLNKVYIRVLGKNGVDILAARARLADPHTVEVGDKTVTAANILVATRVVARDARYSRYRARHHVERGPGTRQSAPAHGDRRRRLHRR